MKNLLGVLLLCLFTFPVVEAQEISSHQYRRVAPADMEEYLKRETTYWKKFAENEVKNGNLTFWGIFQRIGGIDQENTPNILIINSFKDVDKPIDWNSVDDLFPDVKMEDIQTWTLSTNTDHVFLHTLDNHIQVDNPEFNFVRIIYHDKTDVSKHLSFQEEKWKPMLEKAMEEGKTTMQGWGNARILAQSDDFMYNIYSYDLFSSLQAALMPNFTGDHEWPEGFWEDASDNRAPRKAELYRIVAVVTDQDN